MPFFDRRFDMRILAITIALAATFLASPVFAKPLNASGHAYQQNYVDKQNAWR